MPNAGKTGKVKTGKNCQKKRKKLLIQTDPLFSIFSAGRNTRPKHTDTNKQSHHFFACKNTSSQFFTRESNHQHINTSPKKSLSFNHPHTTSPNNHFCSTTYPYITPAHQKLSILISPSKNPIRCSKAAAGSMSVGSCD